MVKSKFRDDKPYVYFYCFFHSVYLLSVVRQGHKVSCSADKVFRQKNDRLNGMVSQTTCTVVVRLNK
jgi:hypothetical protein